MPLDDVLVEGDEVFACDERLFGLDGELGDALDDLLELSLASMNSMSCRSEAFLMAVTYFLALDELSKKLRKAAMRLAVTGK